MTPPDEPDVGDTECRVEGCPWLVMLEEELCVEHMREAADEERAERILDQQWLDERE